METRNDKLLVDLDTASAVLAFAIDLQRPSQIEG